MEKINSPFFPNDGPQPSPQSERPPTPEQPKLVSFNDTAKTICDLVKYDYEISPQFPINFAVINHHIFRVILLGETHGVDAHAVSNARIVDYLWKACNGRVLLFTEDGAISRQPTGQARFVRQEIAVVRWDQLQFEETDLALQNLSKLSIDSVNEMNQIFKEIEHIHSSLSRTINLEVPIENLKTDSAACFAIRHLCNDLTNISKGADKCLILISMLNKKFDEYSDLVKISTTSRNQFLHSFIKENLLKNHEFKICILSGTDHVIPALEFLNREKIAALAMVPKERSMPKSLRVELDGFNNIFIAINNDVEKIKQIKVLYSNVETLSVRLIQMKLFDVMKFYLDNILSFLR